MAKTPQRGSLCLSYKSSFQRKIPTIHLPGQVMNSSAALCICAVQLKIATSALGCFPPQALHTPACSRSSAGAKILSEPTTCSGCSAPAQLLSRSQEMQINTRAPHSTQRFQPALLPEPPHSPLEGSPHPVPSAWRSHKPSPTEIPGVQLGTAPSPQHPASAPGMSAALAFVQSRVHYIKPQLTSPWLPALPR